MKVVLGSPGVHCWPLMNCRSKLGKYNMKARVEGLSRDLVDSSKEEKEMTNAAALEREIEVALKVGKVQRHVNIGLMLLKSADDSMTINK